METQDRQDGQDRQYKHTNSGLVNKTQQDAKVRMVSLENLRAMCERVSGMTRRFAVVKVSRSRVHVEFSNPDEYGNANPMVAVFPCFPSGYPGDALEGDENPRVVLEYLRILHDSWSGDGWQAFEELRECPTLWRSGPGGAWQWRSHREIRAAGGDRWLKFAEEHDAIAQFLISVEKAGWPDRAEELKTGKFSIRCKCGWTGYGTLGELREQTKKHETPPRDSCVVCDLEPAGEVTR